MARTKAAENATDPATGRPLPQGVACRGPHQYRARKLIGAARVTKTFKTARLAREWLEETSASARSGEFVDRRPLDQWTLAKLVQRYVDEVMADGGRRRGAAEDRGHVPSILNDAIGGLKLSVLTPSAVREFRDRQLAAGRAKGTVVKRLNLLASIISHARSEWDVPMRENPATAAAVTRPAGADKKRTRRLRVPGPAAIRLATARGEDVPPTEEEALYAALAKSENEWDILLTRFAIEQATRQGEALGLRWGDVDLEARTIALHGRERKGTKNLEHQEEQGPEVRPLMPAAAAILRDVRPEDGGAADEPVFPVGNYLAFRVRWGRIVAKAGAAMEGVPKDLRYLANLTYHDLRHEGTSRLAKVFRSRDDLKRVTGHRDLKSLDRYYQPDPTELAMVAEEHALARKAGVAPAVPEAERAA